MTRQEIKKWSRQKIKGHMWNLLGIILLANLIGGITSSITVKNEVISFAITIGGGVLAYFMEIGLIRYMVNFVTDKDLNIELLFSKFKDWKQVIITYLHQLGIILLWTLLFIVPGIIKGLGYSLVSYILADNSEISSKDALKLSEEMMNGHKGELFVFNLSFIGWHLLAILTLGIVEFWLLIYQQTATTKFLLEIKNNYEKNHNSNTAKTVEQTAEVL